MKHMTENYFGVEKRDTHHWDIHDGSDRIFAIRGEPGAIRINDLRPKSLTDPVFDQLQFSTAADAMIYLVGRFMWGHTS
jgi:hypothetical protein